MTTLLKGYAEKLDRAMGSDMQIIATGAPHKAAPIVDWARTRVDELEQLWSRFLATSEISQVNASPGTAVAVSAETIELVEQALAARELSAGRFDPTMLRAIAANGYDCTYVSIQAPDGPTRIDTRYLGFGQVEVDRVAGTVCVASDTGFDPGGIGKGLAADMVAAEMIERGADGALVNLGGDMRCIGRGPANGGWVIQVGDEVAGVAPRLVELSEGGIASSTCRRRRWVRPGRSGLVDAHHLLDPMTGRPAESAADFVSVIAANCADAEWLATAIAADGGLPADRSILGGAAVMLTDCEGRYVEFGPVARFVR